MALFPLVAFLLRNFWRTADQPVDLHAHWRGGRNYGAATDSQRRSNGVLPPPFGEARRTTIDLLRLSCNNEAGMGLESGLERVEEEMERSNTCMARVLSGLLDDLRMLPNRRDAFDKLGSTSDGLRRFGTMMSQSLQYGTPLSQALQLLLAEELRRDDSIIKLEERAHKLGAKLTIPMVLFMLPAMFVILGASPFLHLTRAFQPH